MKSSKKKKDKGYEDKYHETRRAAFRAAKRDNRVPVSQQPEEVVRQNDEKWDEYGLNREKNRALYRFVMYLLNLLTGSSDRKEIHIREDTDYSYGAVGGLGDQDEHFNSGEVNEEREKLRRHHYFKTSKSQKRK